MARRQYSKEMAKNSYNLMKTMREAHRHIFDDEVVDVVDGDEEATAERPWVVPLLPKEAAQRLPSVLGEGARSTRTDVMGAGWITHVG